METELNAINARSQSGKHKQAIAEIQTLIETCSTDDGIYKAYDYLGDYLNFMGQHVQAVEAWTNALKLLEDNNGGVDNLEEEKLLDWMNISLGTARVLHRQGYI
jgi:tetratricopeptide (TPR) repeat protein